MQWQTKNTGGSVWTAIFSAIRNAFNFGGRASRSEYWWFTLFVFLLVIVATVVDLSIDRTSPEMGIVAALVVLIHAIPTLLVGVRRLHDIGHSGWWLLICIVPLIGLITLVVFALLRLAGGRKPFWAIAPSRHKIGSGCCGCARA